MLTRYQYQVQGGPKTVGCIGSITYERYFFFAVFLAVFFAVFLVFLQNRYGTETTVSHVSNTEYRYRTKICYTAMHCFIFES